MLEISATAFKQIAAAQSRLLEHVTTTIGNRQAGLDEARSRAMVIAPGEVPQTLLARMRAFLKA